MLVTITGPAYERRLAVDTLEADDSNGTVVVRTYTNTTVVVPANGEYEMTVDRTYTKQDWEVAYQRATCPCGEEADYVCECGCLCCGEDPCMYGCGQAVLPRYRAESKGIAPRVEP